jgi:hypothetical protein
MNSTVINNGKINKIGIPLKTQLKNLIDKHSRKEHYTERANIKSA